MKSIGGYFSLELPNKTLGELYPDAIKLNAGRYCLEYILRVREYKKIYLPYYTCEVILQPIKELGLEYEFYHIDEKLEIAGEINVGRDEVLLYTDYFGLKDQYTKDIAYKYSPNIIIDNTQAFFSKSCPHTDTFNTCRKYFGVADGAYLFTDKQILVSIPSDFSTSRMTAVLDRLDKSPEEAFQEFHKCEQTLSKSGMRKMSKLTQSIMSSINYTSVVCQRLHNFDRLSQGLTESNEIHFTISNDTVPMVYPYYCHKKGLRQYLIKNHIYVAKFWPNVSEWSSSESQETDFAEYLLPIPIDQRYGDEDMNFIIETIKNFQE